VCERRVEGCLAAKSIAGDKLFCPCIKRAIILRPANHISLEIIVNAGDDFHVIERGSGVVYAYSVDTGSIGAIRYREFRCAEVIDEYGDLIGKSHDFQEIRLMSFDSNRNSAKLCPGFIGAAKNEKTTLGS